VTDKIMEACLVLVNMDNHSTFRSKLMGLLGIMLLLHDIQEKYGETTGSPGVLQWEICLGMSNP